MTQQRWQSGLARAGTVVLVFVLVFAGFSLGASDLEAQAGPTVTATNTPEPETCPSDRIDVDPDFYNADCRGVDTALEPLSSHIGCDVATWNGVFGLANPWGKVSCRLGLPDRGGHPPLWMSVFPGCLDVRRTPWPRVIAGRPLRLTQQSDLLAPASLLMSQAGVAMNDHSGWYEIVPGNTPSTAGFLMAAGNYLGQDMGSAKSDEGWSTLNLWPPADRSTTFPSIAYLRVRPVLRYERATGGVRLHGSTEWQDFDDSGVAILQARRSSAGGDAVNGNNLGAGGSQGNGPNNLPAFRVLVETTWYLYLEVEYREGRIINSAYETDDVNHWRTLYSMYGPVSPSQGSYISYRAWDSRITTVAGVQGNICRANENQGYQPIPVLEGQSILTR